MVNNVGDFSCVVDIVGGDVVVYDGCIEVGVVNGKFLGSGIVFVVYVLFDFV